MFATRICKTCSYIQFHINPTHHIHNAATRPAAIIPNPNFPTFSCVAASVASATSEELVSILPPPLPPLTTVVSPSSPVDVAVEVPVESSSSELAVLDALVEAGEDPVPVGVPVLAAPGAQVAWSGMSVTS